MPPKGSIQPNAAMTNLFAITIAGIVPITATRFSGLERLVGVAKLPDQTLQSTGQVQPMDSAEIDIPTHHRTEIAAMDALALLTETGAPLYKNLAQVDQLSANKAIVQSDSLVGFMVRGRKRPANDSGADGAMHVTTYVVAWDDSLPL